ncbi:zf-HC2 domain-containing protein [Candidatus Acetothermia bacterium]|jgi:hypothetical protein|nr:zf-HC2 domain-containing protein [Candidatus Acetothermia bacterium]MCI2427677.1 zf-HC2 domain-containing protein [Candidatus Acetothermia bacterium]MCI2428378.1 zf-HC2 domain-containing protein [Candidatus Acetothermia bacterium]
MDKCAQMQPLLPFYVNETLSSGARTAVDMHIRSCKDCFTEVLDLQKLAIMVKVGVEGISLPEAKENEQSGEELARVMIGLLFLGISIGLHYRDGQFPIDTKVSVLGRTINLK